MEPSYVEETDAVEAALDGVEEAVAQNMEEERVLVRRVRALRAAKRRGGTWSDVLAGETAPGALALVGRVLGRMSAASGTLRRALARSLRAEGQNIPAIARRFGVTHQRISSLLRDQAD